MHALLAAFFAVLFSFGGAHHTTFNADPPPAQVATLDAAIPSHDLIVSNAPPSASYPEGVCPSCRTSFATMSQTIFVAR